MIPIYICDDEKKILHFIKEEIRKYILMQGYSMKISCAAADPEQILEACIDTNSRGIYFLDVDLRNERYNGFTLAREIRKHDPRGYIIFVTTHGELAFETFRHKIEAMDYILKDQYEEIGMRIVQCLGHVQESILQEKGREGVYYTIKVFDDIYALSVEEILYFETSHQKHRVIMHSDDMVLEYFDNLQSVEDEIGPEFIRIHRSYLVNKKRIRAVHLKESSIELDTGEICPISRKGKKLVKEELTETI